MSEQGSLQTVVQTGPPILELGNAVLDVLIEFMQAFVEHSGFSRRHVV